MKKFQQQFDADIQDLKKQMNQLHTILDDMKQSSV